MAILGVTHDADGRVKQSLAVTTKVAIGLGPDEKRNAPRKLDHFVFLKKKQVGSGNKATITWIEDEELTAHFVKQAGGKPTEVEIVLIDDDIENTFPTEYAWWSQGGKVCWGQGTPASGQSTATRRTEQNPRGEPWPPAGSEVAPCGQECPDLKGGHCKPSADLYFWLRDFPALGRVCRIHTSSYRSIRQIHSALQQIQQITGGRLAGIQAKLIVRPEQAHYTSDKDGKRRKTTIWALSLELEAAEVRQMVSRMTETARLFESTRKLLGGRRVEIVEQEELKGEEIEPEFYHVEPEPEPFQKPQRKSVETQEKVAEPAVQASVAAPSGRHTINYRMGEKLYFLSGEGLKHLGQELKGMGAKEHASGEMVIHKAWWSEFTEMCAKKKLSLVELAAAQDSAPSDSQTGTVARGVIRQVKAVKGGAHRFIALEDGTELWLWDNRTVGLTDGSTSPIFDLLDLAEGVFGEFLTKETSGSKGKYTKVLGILRLGAHEWLEDGTPVINADREPGEDDPDGEPL